MAPRQGSAFLKKKFYLFIFRERGREGEREGEKHHCVVASHVPSTRDPALNPGMCPDWELNQQPYGLQASAQSTEPHQPGPTSGNIPEETKTTNLKGYMYCYVQSSIL